ncbi:hypothetical protein ACFX12_034572 [Malus domestica]
MRLCETRSASPSASTGSSRLARRTPVPVSTVAYGGSYGKEGGIGIFIGLNGGKMSGLRPGFGFFHSIGK